MCKDRQNNLLPTNNNPVSAPYVSSHDKAKLGVHTKLYMMTFITYANSNLLSYYAIDEITVQMTTQYNILYNILSASVMAAVSISELWLGLD